MTIKTYKEFCFIILYFLFCLFEANCQSLEILKINTDEYPIIKATFKASDSLNVPLFDISKNNVNIHENNTECEIVYLKAPSKVREPLSVILVFDISGSMKTKRLKIAREAANTFIDEINGTTFELAITTFSNESYINSDFTNDTERLKNVVSSINSMGGTCYDSAFMQSQTGIFELAKKAQYKKVVIFMTDGLSDAKTDTIISVAQKDRITVYCTTIELSMPDILKEISQETGGDYYQKVNDPQKARDIYKDLYSEIVSSDLGTVKWMASTDCEKERTVGLKVKKLKTSNIYSLADRSENNFEVSPHSFFIRQGNKHNEILSTLYLKAIERPVIINAVSTDSPENIKFEELIFPMKIETGQSVNIRFASNKNDTGKLHSQIIIETENCLEKKTLEVFFEDKGKIEITKPEGGEIYAVGTEAAIEWKGIPKHQEVALFFKNENQGWQKIGAGANLQYLWTTPEITGEKYQVKVQTVDCYNRMITKKIEGIHGIKILFDISTDGSMVIYGDHFGQTHVAHIGSGKIIKTELDTRLNYVFFSNDSKKLVKYYSNGLFIQEIFNNPPAELHQTLQGRILSCFNNNTGDEYLLPSEIDPQIYPGEKIRIIERSNERQVFLKRAKAKVKYAAISNDGIITLLLLEDNSLFYAKNEKNSLHKIDDLTPGLKRIIVGPYGKYCFIEYPLNARVVQIKNGKTVMFTSNDIYLRFSPDGNKLMTIDSTHHLNIWDFEKEKKVLSLSSPSLCNFSLSGKYVYYYKDENIFIYDLENERLAVTRSMKDVFGLRISHDDNEFLVLRNAMAEIFDVTTGEPKSKIATNISGGLSDAHFDVNSNIITTNYSMVALWEPQMTYEPGVSNDFKIISPQPDILPVFDFGRQEIRQQREELISEIVKNNTEFPVKIESIEAEDENDVFNIISGNEPFILQPGESREIEVGFNPDTIGILRGNLVVSTPDSSFICQLTGEGIKKAIEFPDKTINFGKVSLYSSRDTSVILLRNISTSSIEINGIINNGPDIEQFEIVSKPGRHIILPGETIKTKLIYNALYPGLTSGTIAVNIKNVAQPVIINLLGEATLPGKVRIFGKVLNNSDSSMVEADLVCKNLNLNRVSYQGVSDTINGFWFNAERGPEYLLYAEKEGFISGSEIIDLNRESMMDSVEKNVFISKLLIGNTIRLNGVFFVFAKAELISTSVNDLNRVLLALESNPSIKLEIHGHTDNIGSDESNLELSGRRTLTIKNYFKDHGIAENRLFIKSFGESHPIADNGTEEGRQMNRRVEFVIKE